MKVKDAMTEDVCTISPQSTLREAARCLSERDAGILPVEENDRLVGMITDRDIVIRAVAEGRGPETPVRDVMSQEVLYCRDDDDIEDVARNMADIQVRRLPVIDRDKRLVGIVSLADFAVAGSSGAAGRALEGVARPGGRHNQSDGAARV
ncbi:MAG TPA: CBS domain-containing protein [Caulobacterales bacterium]|jgi:CBS domain-containing protein|nr:CBS domain-containing protein [Caulobacterales bacterium]